jgi:hypothetical protein
MRFREVRSIDSDVSLCDSHLHSGGCEDSAGAVVIVPVVATSCDGSLCICNVRQRANVPVFQGCLEWSVERPHDMHQTFGMLLAKDRGAPAAMITSPMLFACHPVLSGPELTGWQAHHQ